MAEFQCTLPINYRRKITSTESSPRGNKVGAFADVEPRHVHLWYPSELAAPTDGHADRIAFDATCYPPTALGVKVGDRIELPGEGWFTVVSVSNYDNNPYFVPGIVDVKLRRVDG